ncbi:hemin transporter [Fusobacterium periodonticum]|uniref:hemin transporter n=1 Tax=Fusobacterium periodonticum TaxID=860 RepID=UPI0028D1AD49|nr:hemin transporter [Fusobacterium periodonticum]
MNKLLNDALRAKGYAGPDIKMVLTDVNDPNGPYYIDTLTNTVVFDRKKLASANRDEILNALGHEFGHYSKEDNKTGTQTIANYTGAKLEDRIKDMVAKEATEDTLVAIRNNPNVITGEEGRLLAESIPMKRREYYKALMFNISATKLIVGAGIEVGVIYDKDPITGKEEFGYVWGGKGLFGFDYNAKKINDIGKVALKVDWGFDSYEKKGKPIKDFQGMTAKVEGSIGLFGVGASGEIDTKDNDKISGSVGVEDTRIKAMVTIGYRGVKEFKNPEENLKNAIRSITNNSETTVETIQGIRLMIDAIKKAEELKK